MISINFDSVYRLDDGYGNAGENILLALDRNKHVDVRTAKNWNHTTNTKHGLCARTVQLYGLGFSNNCDYSIRFSQPDSFHTAPTCRRKKIGWSMWEFFPFPKKWRHGVNSVPVRFVSCAHNKQLWIDAGALDPIYIIPLGVDPNIYYYREDGTFHCPEAVNKHKKRDDVFTFIISGTLNNRKNPRMVYNVFNDLFGDRKDVGLIIKSPKRLPIDLKPTHNIRVINDTWWRVRMADLLREADCFVYPTTGEGFGLSPVEAMAVGNAVICTNWSGPADYMNPEYSYPLDYSLTGSTGTAWKQRLYYAEPKADHLKELMWHVYTHQDEAKEKGKLAANFVANNLTWDHTANLIVKYLKEIG